jgi:hypothetical protein
MRYGFERSGLIKLLHDARSAEVARRGRKSRLHITNDSDSPTAKGPRTPFGASVR